MLTKEKLNKKYPIYRDEMTQEQERKFVNDVADLVILFNKKQMI